MRRSRFQQVSGGVASVAKNQRTTCCDRTHLFAQFLTPSHAILWGTRGKCFDIGRACRACAFDCSSLAVIKLISCALMSPPDASCGQLVRAASAGNRFSAVPVIGEGVCIKTSSIAGGQAIH